MPRYNITVTPCPDTPAVGPDTPDMEFLVHIIFVIWAHNHLNRKHYSLSPSLSLSPVTSLSLTSLTSSPSPSWALPLHDALDVISKPRKLQIGVGDLLLHVLFPGMHLISSSSRRKISFKVLQLVPARSIFLGGSKWFTLVNHLYMHPSTRI